jgi:hypothetical protein
MDPMSVLAIGGKAAGTLLSAYGSIWQGKAAMQQARYNARIARMNARAQEIKTTFDQIREIQAGQRRMGALRAKLGASGARLDVGAPDALQGEMAYENALAVNLIGIAGRTQAEQYNAQANAYIAQGKNAQTAANVSAYTSLLSGFGGMQQQGMFNFGGKTGA